MTAIDLYGLSYVVPVLAASPLVIPWLAHVLVDYFVDEVL